MNVPATGNSGVPVWQHTVAQSTPWPWPMRGRRRSDKLIIHPATPNSGVHFVYRGATQAIGTFPAHWSSVVETRGGTVLGDKSGVTLRGALPLLAALRITGIDNALVEVHGPRIPSDFGDFHHYLELLAEAGVRPQHTVRRLLRVTQRIEVRDRYGFAILTPATDFRLSISQSPVRAGGTVEAEYAALCRTLAEPQPVDGTPATGANRISRNLSESPGAARPLREITRQSDALQFRIIELIGHLALAGAPLAGSIYAHELNEAICQLLVRTLLERHAVQPAIADTHHIRTPETASGHAAPNGESGT